jgi:hypothetical protein
LPSAFCCLRKNKIALGAHDLFTRSRSHWANHIVTDTK